MTSRARRSPARLPLAGLLVVLAPAAVESGDPARYGFFLERSFFFVAHSDQQVLTAPPYYTEEDRKRDDDDILFEANVAPHLFFANSLTQEDLRDGTRSEHKWYPTFLGDRNVISFTFLLRLRQLGGFSSPLRNPSFMPRFSLQRLSVTRRDPGHFLSDDWIRVFGPQIVLWGHHSNGGAGCLFLEDTGPDCDSPIPPEDRTVSTRNGNFSTNYIRFGYWFLQAWPEKTGNWMAKSWSLGAWAEVNPSRWGPGSIGAGQRRIYGPYRFGASLELQRQVQLGRTRVNLSLNPTYEYIAFDERPATDSSPHRVIVDLTAVKDTGAFHGWGLALRYYQGQDFYNLLFVRDIRRFQIGLVVDPQRRDLTP